MAIDTRGRLRTLVEQLPEDDLDTAYQALRRLAADSTEHAQKNFDEWLVATGRMERIPPAAGVPRPRKIERLKIPGKPVSETILEERR
jgi:hypothetical protein